jgi:hypothetical protein
MQRRDEEIESVAAVEARLLAVRLEQRRLTQTVMELRARIESLQIREREPAAVTGTENDGEAVDSERGEADAVMVAGNDGVDVSDREECDAVLASGDYVCLEDTGLEATQTQTRSDVAATGNAEGCVAEAGASEWS